jgi:3-phosphoshikimate 1-carboxyvinyltransferase
MSSANLSYPERLTIEPLTKPPQATVRVPGSKSITNRALVLAALTSRGGSCALHGALQSEDTEVMIECLRALGFRVLTQWTESAVFVSSGSDQPLITAHSADLFVANSGTTMRFLTAVVSLGQGRFRLDGVPRMRERPIKDLLDALQQLGVNAFSEGRNDCPPVVVKANGLSGGFVRIKGDISSQFLSGLLLAAPFAAGPVTLRVGGQLVSSPYVFMTVQMLQQWGLEGSYHLGGDCADFAGRTAFLGPARFGHEARDVCLHIPGGQGMESSPRALRTYEIEPDASAASYFAAAAAITGGRVTIAGIPKRSLQGDVCFVDVLAEMGCRVERGPTGITVHGGPLHGIDVDMNDISDTVMTLAAVACFAEGPTTIRKVAHIRHKETDRLAALATELRRVGVEVAEFADGLTITPRPLHGAEIETYNDHRMAMSLALVGLRVPGIVIKNPGCVAKTYPQFFSDLEQLRQEPREDQS